MLVKMQGAIAPDVAADGNGTMQNERRALICYAGDFESMNGPVTVTPEDLQRLADRHNGRLARLGLTPKMADCPPVQLDHSTSARDTVGRVVGPLEVGEFEGRVALYGSIRILGADNLEKVNDGRWTHLSIGADLESGELQEVTITPFPAARQAALLARFGGQMKYAEMLKYLMEKEEMPEDEAKAKLEGMDDEAKEELCKKMAKLSEDKDEEDKTQLGDVEVEIKHDADGDGEVNMNADNNEDDKTNLSSEDNDNDDEKDDDDDKEKAELSAKLSGINKRTVALGLRMRQAHIGNTIMRLKAQGKISPAEIRKMDIAKLAAENKATIDAVLKTYADRQPVIMMGQLGSVEAMDREKLQREAQLRTLENESLANMSFTRQSLGVKLSNGAVTDEGTNANTRDVVEPVQMGDSDGMWNEIVRAVQEGRHEEGKAMFAKACRMGAADVGTTPEDMAELMAAVGDLESDFGAIVQLAGSRLGIQL